MRRLQNQMATAVNHGSFFLRMTAPEHEHQPLAMGVELRNDPIRESFPPPIGMRVRLPCLNSKHGVEQQHALLCPTLQKAVPGNDEAFDIVTQLLIDIAQGRGNIHPRLHRKGKPVGLPGAVVGVS